MYSPDGSLVGAHGVRPRRPGSYPADLIRHLAPPVSIPSHPSDLSHPSHLFCPSCAPPPVIYVPFVPAVPRLYNPLSHRERGQGEGVAARLALPVVEPPDPDRGAKSRLVGSGRGASRTRTAHAGPGILSPSCLPFHHSHRAYATLILHILPPSQQPPFIDTQFRR